MDPTRVVTRRCIAWLLDAACLALALGAVIAITDAVEHVPACPSPVPSGRTCLSYGNDAFLIRTSSIWLVGIVLVVVLIAVFGVCQGLTGTSPGKWVMRIRVVTRDGGTPGVRAGLLRLAGWILDAITLLLPIALWAVWTTPGHRRVGDLLGGTFVVRAGANESEVEYPPRRWQTWWARRVRSRPGTP